MTKLALHEPSLHTSFLLTRYLSALLVLVKERVDAALTHLDEVFPVHTSSSASAAGTNNSADEPTASVTDASTDGIDRGDGDGVISTDATTVAVALSCNEEALASARATLLELRDDPIKLTDRIKGNHTLSIHPIYQLYLPSFNTLSTQLIKSSNQHTLSMNHSHISTHLSYIPIHALYTH